MVPDAQRRSAIVLATHLIRGGALEERDEDALLGWAVRDHEREGRGGGGVWWGFCSLKTIQFETRVSIIYTYGISHQ